MKSTSRTPSGRLLLPFLALVFTSPIWQPSTIEAQGCGSCAAASGSYQQWGGNVGLGSAFPTLNQQFGGSDALRIERLTHSGPQTIVVTTRGTTTTFTGPLTQYINTSGKGSETQVLPGEKILTSITNISNNNPPNSAARSSMARSSSDEVTQQSSANQSCNITVDSTGRASAPVTSTAVPGQGNTNISVGGAANDGNGGPRGLVPAVVPAAPSEPPRRSNPNENEYQGTAFQSGPGGAAVSIDPQTNQPLLNSDGSPAAARDIAPTPMLAVSLGNYESYLVPVPVALRPLYGPGLGQIGPEKIGYYTARNFEYPNNYHDGLTTVPITGDRRWHTTNGLTILSQVSPTMAKIEVFPLGQYNNGSVGFPLNQDDPATGDATNPINEAAVSRRTTTVEKLSSGNPNSAFYSTGYQVRTAVVGFPVKLETTWTGDVVISVSGRRIYSRITRSLENIPGSITHETVSTRDGMSLDRVIDLKTTEVVQQPAYAGATPLTETIVVRSREKRRLFLWGEETIEATTYLTPPSTGPTLTAYTYWYDVPQTNPNYSSPRLKIAPDGRWEAFFKGVPDAAATSTGPFLAGSLTGWKNTPPPTSVTTPAGLAALVSTTGYTADLTSTRFGENPLRTERYENGFLIAKSEDLTPASLDGSGRIHRTTTKRYASPTSFFITVTTRYNSAAIRDVFQLKENQVPADLTVDPDLSLLFAWQHSSNWWSSGGFTTTVHNALRLPSTGSVVFDSSIYKPISIDSLIVNSIYSGGSPDASETLRTESWKYDARGRPTAHYKDLKTVESWSYPSEYVVDHTDASGIRHWMEYEPQGRLVRDVIMPVTALAITDMPGSPTLNAPVLTRYYTTEWLYRAPDPAVPGSVSNTVKLVTTKASINGAPLSVRSWRREWTEHIDGLARPVSTLDPLGTTKNLTYLHGEGGTDVTTAIPGPFGGTHHIASTYLSGQQKSTLFPVHPTITTLEKAGSDVYYDYVAALYASTIMAGNYPTFTLAYGYKALTTDGLGRISSTLKPTGMTRGALNLPVLNMHNERRTYDNQGRLLSRSLPGASAAHFEVYSYSDRPSSDLTTKKALSTDAVWDAADASQSIIETGYELDEFWQRYRTVTHPGDTGLESYTVTPLGGFSAAPETTTMGTWILTGTASTYSGGATVAEKAYRFPNTALTRTRRYVDGALRLTITSYNGLPLLYDTNGTTYASKIASHSVLRDALSYVDPASGYWPYRSVSSTTGLTSYEYLPSGILKTLTTWFSGNDFRASSPSSRYNYASPGAYTYFDYNARGQRIRVWGGESPAQTTYDILGRMKFLSTYRAGTGWTSSTWPTAPGTADTTEWTYPPSTSLQLSKIYPDAGGQTAASRTVGYIYYPNGSPATRYWQRLASSFSNTTNGARVVTSYLYDAYARLQTIDYPAASTTVAATPDVGFTYDAAGRTATRTEAGQATTSYLYQPWGAAWKETIVSANPSLLLSSVVERTFDVLNRPDLLKVSVGGTAAPDVDYNFNATTGLLDNVVSDSRTMTYGYNGIGAAPTALSYSHSGSTLLSTARPLSPSGLISGITHNQGATSFQSLNYTYSVDQVTSVTRGAEEDTMRWDYRYDTRRQVTSADKKFSNGEFANGLQTEYTYDMAGNRLTKGQGGNSGSTVAPFVESVNLRTTTYGAANALNQYPSITNPNSGGNTWIDIAGRRGSTSEIIKVNNLLADYQQNATTGLSFRKELLVPLSGGTNGSRTEINVTSTLGGTTTTLDSGRQYSPPAAETLTYDADGNLTQDARWKYSWDAENRLASLTPVISGPAAGVGSQESIYYTYDGLSRRVSCRVVSILYQQTGTTVSAVAGATFRRNFTYDAWNMVQSLNSGGISGDFGDIYTPLSRLSFIWGPDIGSSTHGHTSWQKAGGVGGLLAVLATAANPMGFQFPLMDRLGNVTGYRRAVSGSPAALDAVYEYDAFGREVRSTGPASDLMPFRFSTKYTDAETGLVYYGYRFYDPDRGRWVNRDPIGERGGRNLYVAANNAFIVYADTNGLSVTSGPGGDINNGLPSFDPPPSSPWVNPWLDYGENPFLPKPPARSCAAEAAACAARGAVAVGCYKWAAGKLSQGAGSLGELYTEITTRLAGVGYGLACAEQYNQCISEQQGPR